MKSILISALFAAVLLIFFKACSASINPISSDSDITVFSNGLLIDGRGGAPLEKAVVVIEKGLIRYAGTGAGYIIPDTARIVDVGGYTILPGFINSHVHSAYVKSHLKTWAHAAVTTVRDLGDFAHEPAESFALRDILLQDNRYARLVAAGPLVTSDGGYGNYGVTSEANARQKVNGLIAAGADIIKIAIEDDLQGRTWPMLTAAEIEAIVQTAHEQNIPVAAHVSRAKHLEMALDGRVDDVVHMIIDPLPDTLISRMVMADMYWVPTLELWDGVSQLYNLNYDAIAQDNLSRFVQAGGKVALGTDFAGYSTHFDSGMPLREIELMRQAGMTVMDIIVAATKHGAHVCHLEEVLGTIEAGKIADIWISRANPLQNITAFNEVYMVMHNGVIIRETN